MPPSYIHSGFLRLIFMCVLSVLFAYHAHAQQKSSCNATPSGRNFAGQSLTRQNFSHQDLTGANFQHATLTAVSFLGANLTNASFQYATFIDDSKNSVLVNDFTFANLTATCFQNSMFTGTTYFTSSTLTCTDFSESDISTQPVFGQSPLTFDRSGNTCRPAFRSSTMSCEFLPDWQYLDLTKANIKACYSQLTKFSFPNAQLSGVDFTGANLDGVNFGSATLTEATLTEASLQNADLSYAKLQGASLNNANLTGANLYNAFLANDVQGQVDSSATARQAHLKNVNLSFATLSGVDFTYANFYSTLPAGQSTCQTQKPNYQGFTINCSSAHAAKLSDTKFINAYLFGVDFTGSEIRGVDFTSAVLIDANLATTIATNTFSGTRTTMFRAYLQGANLGAATFSDEVSLSEAFVDFPTEGNIVNVYLSGVNHNQFACLDTCNPSTGADVCTETYYLKPTTVPAASANVGCPNGTPGPCGQPDPGGSNAQWKSSLLAAPLPPGLPPFWYARAPTYPPASSPGPVCAGIKPTNGW